MHKRWRKHYWYVDSSRSFAH